MLSETKIGIVPLLIVNGALGPKEYGVLVTDQRLVFVLEKKSKAALIGAIGDALLTDRKAVDYQNESPDALAADDNNIAVPYAGIQMIRLKKSFGSFTLKLEYADQNGKSKKLAAMLSMPAELAQRKRAEGMKGKQALEEYVRKVRELLEKALPPGAMQKAEWDV